MSSSTKKIKKYDELDLDLCNLNHLRIENFSKSTLDISNESMDIEESESDENGNVRKIEEKTENEFNKNLDRCLLYWKEHLSIQRKIK